LGKGLSGLVFKPLSGAVLFGSKTLEGIVSTPDTIIEKIREGDKRHFGIPLEESLQKSVASQQSHITTKILQYLLNTSLEQEGLFRIAGKKERLEHLRKDIDTGKDVKLETWQDDDGHGCGPHDAASLLKLYLNNLPEPLFLFETYSELVALAESSNSRAHAENFAVLSLRLFLMRNYSLRSIEFDDPNNLEEDCLSDFANILKKLPKGNRVRISSRFSTTAGLLGP
jgi:hypothetical protein